MGQLALPLSQIGLTFDLSDDVRGTGDLAVVRNRLDPNNFELLAMDASGAIVPLVGMVNGAPTTLIGKN